MAGACALAAIPSGWQLVDLDHFCPDDHSGSLVCVAAAY